MSCLQARTPRPLIGHKVASPSLSRSSYLHASCSCSFPSQAFNHRKALPRLVCSIARYQESASCLFHGRRKYDHDNKAPPSNAIEKAIHYFGKGPPLHGMLRKQMTERQFGGGGGSGRHRGDGGDGSGDEDGRFTGILNELLQVVLATVSFMLVYFCLIRREELTRLSNDYIKYLLGSKPSPRLKRTMHAWRRFFDRIKGKQVKEESEDTFVSSST